MSRTPSWLPRPRGHRGPPRLPLAAAPAAAQGQGDPDLKAVTAYTLTMPKYKQYLEASVNIANAVAKDKAMLPRLDAYGNKPMAEQIKVLDGIPQVNGAPSRRRAPPTRLSDDPGGVAAGGDGARDDQGRGRAGREDDRGGGR